MAPPVDARVQCRRFTVKHYVFNRHAPLIGVFSIFQIAANRARERFDIVFFVDVGRLSRIVSFGGVRIASDIYIISPSLSRAAHHAGR